MCFSIPTENRLVFRYHESGRLTLINNTNGKSIKFKHFSTILKLSFFTEVIFFFQNEKSNSDGDDISVNDWIQVIRHPFTAKNTVISPDFPVPFRKIPTPGNQVKLQYFSQCLSRVFADFCKEWSTSYPLKVILEMAI